MGRFQSRRPSSGGTRAESAHSSFNTRRNHVGRFEERRQEREERSARRAQRRGGGPRPQQERGEPRPARRATTRSRPTATASRSPGLTPRTPSSLCSAEEPGLARALLWSGSVEQLLERAQEGKPGGLPLVGRVLELGARSARARPHRRAPHGRAGRAGGDRARSQPGCRRGRAGSSLRGRTARRRGRSRTSSTPSTRSSTSSGTAISPLRDVARRLRRVAREARVLRQVVDDERLPRHEHPAGDAGAAREALAERACRRLRRRRPRRRARPLPRRAGRRKPPSRGRSPARPRRSTRSRARYDPRRRGRRRRPLHGGRSRAASRRSSRSGAARSSAGTASARGCLPRIEAQIPATCGVAKLLPVAVIVSPPSQAISTFGPRAKNSTGGCGLA